MELISTLILLFVVFCAHLIECQRSQSRYSEKGGYGKNGDRRISFSSMIVFKGNGTRVIECPINVSPAVGVSWKKNGVDFEDWEDTRFQIGTEGRFKGRITITNVTDDDEGIYECTAAFGRGERSASVTLTVAEKESINLTPNEWRKLSHNSDGENVTSNTLRGDAPFFPKLGEMMPTVVDKIGGKLQLGCRARGRPTPRYRWFKNGAELVSHKGGRFLADHPIQSIYSIEELKGEDAGNYTCEAHNVFGKISYTYEVQVDDCIDARPKILQIEATRTKLYPGDNTTLSCLVKTCLPEATFVAWHQPKINDARFDHEMKVLGCNRHTVGKNLIRCTFDITSFEAEDARGYLCYATMHGASDVHLLTLELDLQPRPAQSSAEAERPRKNLAYVFGGIAAVVAIALILFCLCICRGCCSMSKKDDALVTKSSSSTFRRQIAPDYIIAGQQESLGHYDYAVCGKSASTTCSSPPSPRSAASFPHHSVHESLLKSPGVKGKGDGSGTEYEDVAEDLSVYCTQHPPSVVSSYAVSCHDPSLRYVPFPRLSTLY